MQDSWLCLPWLDKAIDDMGLRVEAVHLGRQPYSPILFALYMMPRDRYIEPYMILTSEHPLKDGNWESLPYKTPRLPGYKIPVPNLPAQVLFMLKREVDEDEIYCRAIVPRRGVARVKQTA